MTNRKSTKLLELREACEASLLTFIRVIHPGRVIGDIHKELIEWWCRSEARSHQLVLLPRDHGKSAYVAYRVAWEITKDPTLRVLYISSTANLAQKQLKFIKDILTSPTYRMLWPEMVNKEEGKREKWTETEIAVDHPRRREEFVRDPTVFTAGLTTGITGMHCDIAVMDDVVVKENAYNEEGRDKVRQQYSLLASIEGADAREWIVGTRYDPNDLYNDLLTTNLDIYDEDGNLIDETPLYEVFERKVENIGDGTGEFLWPRQQRSDGKWFGFNPEVLAKKRAQYLDQTQFRAQYYNDPNDISDAPIDPGLFQYYEPSKLHRLGRYWAIAGRRLNVYAAIDFAFSMGNRADYTSLVVVGVDHNVNYYILEIDRFKTGSIKDYFDHILKAHEKWDFTTIRMEVTAAQQAVVNELKTSYIMRLGLDLSVDEYRPSRHEGTKEERILATLKPRYENLAIWHYRGGNCQVLEEELTKRRPSHDDVKDALTAAISLAEGKAPTMSFLSSMNSGREMRAKMSHKKFGGIHAGR